MTYCLEFQEKYLNLQLEEIFLLTNYREYPDFQTLLF